MNRETIKKAWAGASRLVQNRKFQKSVSVVAAVAVVFGTISGLVLPASTLTPEAVCGKTEHVHTEECFSTESVLICGLAESQGHTHDSFCYTPTLICGQEEGEEHQHTVECYTYDLTCGQAESQGHAHTEACYEEKQVLICGMEEHRHTDSCFREETPAEPDTPEEPEEPAEEPEEEPEEEPDLTADLETAEDWEATLAGVALTGNWNEDLVAVAETQEGYTESRENYELLTTAEGEQRQGYSRYGAWYGDPYGDWCAMFVSFCLHYAEIPTESFPQNSSCEAWIEELTKKELYTPAAEADPESGDLVFLDGDEDGFADHVGIVYKVNEEDETLISLEGNSRRADGTDGVQKVGYARNNEKILGYGLLPENPALTLAAEEEPQYAYAEGEDYVVAVCYGESAGLPENVAVLAEEITQESEAYDFDAYAQAAEEAVAETADSVRLFNITLVDGATGQAVQPAAAVSVSISLKEAAEDCNLQIVHFPEPEVYTTEETETGTPAETSETLESGPSETDRNPLDPADYRAPESPREAPSAMPSTQWTGLNGPTVSCVTEGFSVYAVVSVSNVSDLNGNAYIILNNEQNKVLRYKKNGSGSSSSSSGSLEAKNYTAGSDIKHDDATVWTFESDSSGDYYLKNSSEKYLKVTKSGDSFSYSLVDNKNDATHFTVAAVENSNGGVTISCSLSGTTYYLSYSSGSSNPPSNGSFTFSQESYTLYLAKQSGTTSGGTGETLSVNNWNGNAVVFWDTYSPNGYTDDGKINGAKVNNEARSKIASNGVSLNSGSVSKTVVQQDANVSQGSSYSTTNGVKLSEVYTTGTPSSEEVAGTLTITPIAGYYVKSVVIVCTQPNAYSCNTFNGGHAFEATFEVSSGGTVTMDCSSLQFCHASHSGIYFILIEVLPIPSPLWVEYDPGDIVNHVSSSTYNYFDYDAWVSLAEDEDGNSKNVYYPSNTTDTVKDVGGVRTNYTQFKYVYDTDAAGANSWEHYANTVTQNAKNAAAAEGYYFAGWKVEYYTKVTENDSNTTANPSYGNYSWTFSTAYGSTTVSEGEKVVLSTNCRLIAQWQPYTVTVKKVVTAEDGLAVSTVLGTNGQSYTMALAYQQSSGGSDNGKTFADKTLTVTNSTPYEASETFSPLIPGVYTVTETNAGTSIDQGGTTYYCATTYNIGESSVNYFTVTKDEILAGSTNGGGVTVTVTNHYSKQPPTIDLTVKKIASGTSNALSDAKFQLYKTENGSNTYYKLSNNAVTWVGASDADTFTSDASTGEFKIQSLPNGTYYLVETEAPAGYNLLSSPITLVVANGSLSSATSGTSESKTYSVSSTDGSIVLTIPNDPGVMLPSTGSPGGVIPILAGGTLLILTAALLWGRKKRGVS